MKASQAPYIPSMPESTKAIAEPFRLDMQEVFDLQIELVTDWLMRQVAVPYKREVLYASPLFWRWALADWSAIDDMIQYDSTVNEDGSIYIGNLKMNLCGPARKNYYIHKHKAFYKDKPIYELPNQLLRLLSKPSRPSAEVSQALPCRA